MQCACSEELLIESLSWYVAKRLILDKEECVVIIERKLKYVRSNAFILIQENGIPLFRDGSQVEVSRSAKTFGKYWSPAIILKVIGATSFLVQYKDVRDDGEQVTEILDSQYIRPSRKIIHMDSKYRFPPSSHVEVFHEGSWWTGAILEILDSESPKKYVVKIKSEDADMDDVQCVDLLTVDHTQLRPKYDWYRGKWVRFLTEVHIIYMLCFHCMCLCALLCLLLDMYGVLLLTEWLNVARFARVCTITSILTTLEHCPFAQTYLCALFGVMISDTFHLLLDLINWFNSAWA